MSAQTAADVSGSSHERVNTAGDAPQQDEPMAQRDDSPLDESMSGYEIDADVVPRTQELKIALDFNRFIAGATLENGDLGVEELESLLNPARDIPEIDSDDLLLSLKLFLSTTNASNQVYHDVRNDIMDVHPRTNCYPIMPSRRRLRQ